MRGNRLSGLAVLGALLALVLTAPPAGANTVKHVGSLADERVDDAGGCQRTLFFKWSELPGADSYTLELEDTLGFGGTFTYPPYHAESEGPFGGLPPVTKGQHRIALTYQGGGVGGCQTNDIERFTVKRFTASYCMEESAPRPKPRTKPVRCETQIVGTTTKKDGTPIRGVLIELSDAGSVRTNGNGAYRRKVGVGPRTISAPKGYCVKGGGKCKRSIRVNVRLGQTSAVHFVRSDELVTLSGTVKRRVCAGDDPFNCSELERAPAPAQVVAATGGATSAATVTGTDGGFDIDVPRDGTYALGLPDIPATEFAPSTRTVAASKDVGGLDFTICTVPDNYVGEPVGCDLVEIDGKVVDVTGEPYADALVKGGGDSAVANGSGKFSLMVTRGEVALHASDKAAPLLGRTIGVKAAKAVNREQIKLPPDIPVALTPKRTGFVINATSLPLLRDGFDLSAERKGGGEGKKCAVRSKVVFFNGENIGDDPHGAGSEELRRNRSAKVVVGAPERFEAFCSGTYVFSLSLRDGRRIARTEIVKPRLSRGVAVGPSRRPPPGPSP